MASPIDQFIIELADGPAERAVPVTPSDTTDLAYYSRALYIGSSGDVTVIMQGGQTVTFTGMVAGQIYPLRVGRVKAAGTTAAAIVALW